MLEVILFLELRLHFCGESGFFHVSLPETPQSCDGLVCRLICDIWHLGSRIELPSSSQSPLLVCFSLGLSLPFSGWCIPRKRC